MFYSCLGPLGYAVPFNIFPSHSCFIVRGLWPQGTPLRYNSLQDQTQDPEALIITATPSLSVFHPEVSTCRSRDGGTRLMSRHDMCHRVSTFRPRYVCPHSFEPQVLARLHSALEPSAQSAACVFSSTRSRCFALPAYLCITLSSLMLLRIRLNISRVQN